MNIIEAASHLQQGRIIRRKAGDSYRVLNGSGQSNLEPVFTMADCKADNWEAYTCFESMRHGTQVI